MTSQDEVVLIEGPAGTGKSLIACFKFHTISASRPKLRVLLARKTRRSLTDSIMVTYENAVLASYAGGASMIGKSRSNRDRYVYPNGTEVVLAGFDDPQKILSSEYDLIVIEQAEQCLLGDVELALTRLRNNSGYEPKQMILVANPGPPTHFLLSWAKENKLRWLRSRIQDNPLYWDADKDCFTPDGERYMSKQSRLTGVNYKKYVLGEWCGEEGVILRYEPQRHLVHGRLEKAKYGWQIVTDTRTIALDWFAAGVDWGDTSPGAMVLVGYDRNHHGYVVRQWYRRDMTTDWWAGVADRVYDEFKPVVFVCDSAQKDRIRVFNTRLGQKYGRDAGASAVRANKEVLTGISELQEQFDSGTMHILAGSLAHEPDPSIAEGQPTCLEEELPQWVWLRDKISGLTVDRPDPRRADHAIDALRYLNMWAQDRSYSRDRGSLVEQFKKLGVERV